jgi:hypothetical protein
MEEKVDSVGFHFFFVIPFYLQPVLVRGSVVVKALYYKPESRGFDT